MADEAAKIAALDKHKEKFIEVMDDDLNTADGIAAIFELVSEINLDVKDGASKSFAEEALKRIRELTEVLGIFGGEDEEENKQRMTSWWNGSSRDGSRGWETWRGGV
jgi:cysteinyl-tRNA synthetase